MAAAAAAAAASEYNLYPSQEDLPYEEELIRNPFSLRLWWRYLVARNEAPFKKRALIYERAVKSLPGSYKLWHSYLRERLTLTLNLPLSHPQYQTLNNTFERALITMHKMPRIWTLYLQTLTRQCLLTRSRLVFDRALSALPVTQHDRIWEPYLLFVARRGVPVETSLRVYRRYLKYDPSHIEDFIDFLLESSLWQEAAERLAGVLNDDSFVSIKGKTKHRLWLELCDLLTLHSDEVSGLNVDAIIRGGIRRFTDEVGRLWTSLADYYIRRGLPEKARDTFEEGVTTVVTVRDFSVIFDAYSQFEESMLACRMESTEDGDEENEEEGFEDARLDSRISAAEFERRMLSGFWLQDLNDVNLRLSRLENLLDRRPELANSVLLRQNPHNVEQWHRRVKLFAGDPKRQILTYTEAVRTVDPMKAVGRPHTLWVAFAKLYQDHKDIVNARVIFEKAVQVDLKTVDNLASIWCEWAEMEMRHKNFQGARALLKRATTEPSVEVKRRVAAGGNEPVQMKLHRSLRLWTFYVDLEESLGTMESTCEVYERILDLRIATPQIIINYALFLEEHKYFEKAFKVYEIGVKIFKYPHVKDIWITYLTKFVKRYGRTKLERSRELFEHAIEMATGEVVKSLYLQYAKVEEEHGMAKRAMKVYERGTKAVPAEERLGMYEIYIARAGEIFGVPKTREIYEEAIQSGLPEKEVKVMCMRYAEVEKKLGEIDRARGIYVYASQFSDPFSDTNLPLWDTWHSFEVHHGNEDTFREMLRIKRTVSATYAQTHFVLPEYAMQKKEASKEAGGEDGMAMLEKRLQNGGGGGGGERKVVGFVSAGAGTEAEEVANREDIDLQDSGSEEEDEKDNIEITQKQIPAAVFGGLLPSAPVDSGDDGPGSAHIGALERIKRQRRS